MIGTRKEPTPIQLNLRERKDDRQIYKNKKNEKKKKKRKKKKKTRKKIGYFLANQLNGFTISQVKSPIIL